MEGRTLEAKVGSLSKKNLVTDDCSTVSLQALSKINKTYFKSHSPVTCQPQATKISLHPSDVNNSLLVSSSQCLTQRSYMNT